MQYFNNLSFSSATLKKKCGEMEKMTKPQKVARCPQPMTKAVTALRNCRFDEHVVCYIHGIIFRRFCHFIVVFPIWFAFVYDCIFCEILERVPNRRFSLKGYPLLCTIWTLNFTDNCICRMFYLDLNNGIIVKRRL